MNKLRLKMLEVVLKLKDGAIQRKLKNQDTKIILKMENIASTGSPGKGRTLVKQFAQSLEKCNGEPSQIMLLS